MKIIFCDYCNQCSVISSLPQGKEYSTFNNYDALCKYLNHNLNKFNPWIYIKVTEKVFKKWIKYGIK